ncbi:hypothetical protein [Clostridium phage XP41-N3]|nr:hypothetical protein [Clostridium phage XP41-N3]
MKRSTLEKLKEMRNKYKNNDTFGNIVGFYDEGINEGISRAIMVLIENEEIEEDGIN